MRYLTGIGMRAACLAVAGLIPARPLLAGCNLIPEQPVRFRGVSGSIDRAFVQPGDVVRVTLGSAAGIPHVERATDLTVTVAIRSTAAEPRTMRAAAVPAVVQVKVPDANLAESYPAPPIVTFTFPQTDAAGPAVIAIGFMPDGFPDGAVLTSCDGTAPKGLLACFDTLQAPPGTELPSCTGTVQLIALPAPNDFRALCTGQDETPNCTGLASDVRFAIDQGGNAYIPVLWGNILRPGPGGPPPYQRRRVHGNSAVQAFLYEPGRIMVPNEDYLGTSTLVGTGFSSKPLFEPDNTPSLDHRNVLALTGRSDKGDSVLRICRRAPGQYECGQGPQAGTPCDPIHDALACPGNCQPVFFTCARGPRDGKPCTRQPDCVPGGTCRPGSTCRQQWVDTQTPCRTDADCAGGEECGPGLFEFRYDNRATNNIVTIPRAASTDADNIGVCDAPPYKGIPCFEDSFCDGGSGPTPPRCVAFRAHAGKRE